MFLVYSFLFIIFFFFFKTFFLQVFFFARIFFFTMPDWWYYYPITDFLVRRFLLCVRWCYRKVCRRFSALPRIYRRYLKARWDFWWALGDHWPHFFVQERSDEIILVFYIPAKRIFWTCVFFLCWGFIKCFFFSFVNLFSAFYRKLYANSFVSFLLYRGKPLSFCKFTLMLGVLVAMSWVLFRVLNLSYSNFFALLAFLGVTPPCGSEFISLGLSSIMIFFLFIFLEGLARLCFIVFFKGLTLRREPFKFWVFFSFFVFGFFVGCWLFFLYWPSDLVLCGLSVYHTRLFFCLLFFFILDFFFFYTYRIIWGIFQCQPGLIS